MKRIAHPRVQRYPKWFGYPPRPQPADSAMRDAAWVAWSVAAFLAIVLLSGRSL